MVATMKHLPNLRFGMVHKGDHFVHNVVPWYGEPSGKRRQISILIAINLLRSPTRISSIRRTSRTNALL